MGCRQEGHMASDCPEPEVCRRCRKEGHVMDDCPEPEKCFNCRQEGHSSSDCPEPELCRKCRKPQAFTTEHLPAVAEADDPSRQPQLLHRAPRLGLSRLQKPSGIHKISLRTCPSMRVPTMMCLF